MNNITFDIKIYGVEKRISMIKNTISKLNLTDDDVFFR